jgi:DNA-binding SARP family transcriptional activator
MPRLPREASLPRKRLLEVLPQAWDCRLCLVVAPAGSGKTTLLAQFANAAGVPVAYYGAEPGDEEADRFLARIAAALAKSVPGLTATWPNAEDGASLLEQELPSRTLLLVDDFHVLHGTPAEASFERLLAYAPSRLATVVASRSRPGFNWSRLVVTGSLFELGADDLRFRSWEVEELFCGLYGEPLPPEDLADLTRRTEGWAAGLRLFYLATRGRPPSERRRTLASLQARWRLAREYLAQNVLDDLDEELRSFLVETCVLPRLSGSLCDELLGRTGSGRLLRHLEARQLFTYELGDGSYRYHETLRSYLEDVLAERLGEAGARARFARAGEILETSGFPSDALVAYCRGEAWPAVARLLGRDGERIVAGRPLRLDALPPGLIENDPWLLLAFARQQVAVGRFGAAVALYRDAERRAKGTAAAEVSRRERSALSLWLEPNPPLTEDALGLVRAATIDQPRDVRLRAVALGTSEGALAGGLAALLAGECADAASLLRVARDTLEPGRAAAAAAHVALAVALLLSGDPAGPAEARVAAEVADRGGFPWLSRLARAASGLAFELGGAREGPVLAVVGGTEHDGWPASVGALLEGLGALRRGEGRAPFLAAIEVRFRELGAGVLETWARAALGLARARTGDPRAGAVALDAERLARLRGVPGAQALARLALAELDDERASDRWDSFRTLEAACSLVLTASGPDAVNRSRGRVEIRCFGTFELVLDGERVDLATVKPRARSLLAILVLRAGAPVHREVVIEALWPGSSPLSAARSLHVVVSTLRRALEPGRARGDASFIRREGEAYRLELPEDALIDLISFESALAEARAGRAAGALDRTLAACERALDLYRGELLPAEGPAEWLLHERERRAAEACEAAALAAEALLEQGETRRAVTACERGLVVDRYDGALWRLWADAQERAGDVGGALRTRRRYERLLLELTGEAHAG